MKRFAALFAELDTTTATNAKVAALARYFAAAPAADAAWAVYFLAGGKPRQVVPTRVLRTLACERAGIRDWLFDASYHAVGDFAETVAHVLPPPVRDSDLGLGCWVEERLLPLRGLDAAAQAARVAQYWDELDKPGRFLFNKLIGGELRVGVSKLLVQRALAQTSATAHGSVPSPLPAADSLNATPAWRGEQTSFGSLLAPDYTPTFSPSPFGSRGADTGSVSTSHTPPRFTADDGVLRPRCCSPCTQTGDFRLLGDWWHWRRL